MKIVEKSKTEWESLNKETNEKEIVIWNQALTEGTIQNKTTGETSILEVKQDASGKKTVYENGQEVASLEVESSDKFDNNSMLRAYSPWKYIHTYKVNVNAYASAASVGYAIAAVVGGSWLGILGVIIAAVQAVKPQKKLM
ncbi:hypothetical protein ACRW9N_00030 [Listeria aquatica]|uniref:hypothetical protein n=1 Tax=Listeria aquatica TaxID=1494960 RepID=UPI003EF63178